MKEYQTNLDHYKVENDLAIKTIERQKSDLLRKEENIMFFENTIKALKNEINLLLDKNSRLQNDYTRMCFKTDTMTYEFENKIKSVRDCLLIFINFIFYS